MSDIKEGDAIVRPEVIVTPEWTANPYLVPKDRGKGYSAPSVPAIVWWLENLDLKLSHVRYNVMTGRVEAELLSWDEAYHSWTDTDQAHLFYMLQEATGGLIRNRDDMLDALRVFSFARKFDPLQEMLEGLPPWDGKDRAAKLLVDFLGADDTPYTRAVTRHFLNGAIMRAEKPGCKFDECVILQGAQGTGKSSFVRALPVEERFARSGIGQIGNKDAKENIQGAWIVELEELYSLKGRDGEAVKSFISAQEDVYRTPFGKFSDVRPRRCIFVGTTNDVAFLKDVTGNRRFLVVEVAKRAPRLMLEGPEAKEHIAQAWAEVLDDYRSNGGSLPLVLPDNVLAEAERIRVDFEDEDPRTETIRNWLRQFYPGALICSKQIAIECLKFEEKDLSENRNKHIYADVRRLVSHKIPELEEEPGRPFHSNDYGQQRCWRYRPEQDDVQAGIDHE